MSQNPLLIKHTLDENFNLPTGGFFSEDARGNNPRVVEDHQVARLDEIQHLRKLSVRYRTGAAIQLQQTTAAAPFCRPPCNERIGQLIKKILATHEELTLYLKKVGKVIANRLHWLRLT